MTALADVRIGMLTGDVRHSTSITSGATHSSSGGASGSSGDGSHGGSGHGSGPKASSIAVTKSFICKWIASLQATDAQVANLSKNSKSKVNPHVQLAPARIKQELRQMRHGAWPDQPFDVQELTVGESGYATVSLPEGAIREQGSSARGTWRLTFTPLFPQAQAARRAVTRDLHFELQSGAATKIDLDIVPANGAARSRSNWVLGTPCYIRAVLRDGHGWPTSELPAGGGQLLSDVHTRINLENGGDADHNVKVIRASNGGAPGVPELCEESLSDSGDEEPITFLKWDDLRICPRTSAPGADVDPLQFRGKNRSTASARLGLVLSGLPLVRLPESERVREMKLQVAPGEPRTLLVDHANPGPLRLSAEELTQATAAAAAEGAGAAAAAAEDAPVVQNMTVMQFRVRMADEFGNLAAVEPGTPVTCQCTMSDGIAAEVLAAAVGQIVRPYYFRTMGNRTPERLQSADGASLVAAVGVSAISRDSTLLDVQAQACQFAIDFRRPGQPPVFDVQRASSGGSATAAVLILDVPADMPCGHGEVDILWYDSVVAFDEDRRSRGRPSRASLTAAVRLDVPAGEADHLHLLRAGAGACAALSFACGRAAALHTQLQLAVHDARCNALPETPAILARLTGELSIEATPAAARAGGVGPLFFGATGGGTDVLQIENGVIPRGQTIRGSAGMQGSLSCTVSGH
ncbi:hypothetical protein JKP88DRAFT_276234 [Tribonema minus]|uniref:Uncharacterized protein n=1 Tax=Tribonema minus TaxID=303371 RepID=A0A835Z4G0_9STRA|nr:hypothetical protein JKP88DRAFT_276234 [Tribonema minus]